MRPKRPFGVTLLAWAVIILAVLNLIRMEQTLVQWQFLAGLLPVSPVYLALSGLVWGLAGLPLAWGIWRGKSWAPAWTVAGILAYSLYFWLDRLLLEGYPGRNIDWMFWAAANVIFFIYSLVVLRSKRARLFFNKPVQ